MFDKNTIKELNLTEEQTKKMELTDVRTQRVRKANELIQKSRFSLSTQQQKIILYLISKISPYDEDFKLYEFSIMDFCEVCGIPLEGGRTYTMLKEAIKTISDKSMWVKLPNGKETLLRWIEKPYIDERNGTIQIKLDTDMKPYLLQLYENYTQYELIYTLRFNSKYSIRLYELLNSVHYDELKPYRYEIEIERLKVLIDATNYDNFTNFFKRVLTPAIKEINLYSDKTIEYKLIKEKKTYKSIIFDISHKEPIDRFKIAAEIEEEFNVNQLKFPNF